MEMDSSIALLIILIVYGGEAFMNGSWAAVAVKTLPICATMEEKVDFLYEAQVSLSLSTKSC